jgi:ABC-type nitrate/sulfonate/bicarbonate transport system substrate-binding protein
MLLCMKTDPGRRASPTLIVILLAAVVGLTVGGCATKTGTARKSVPRPGPYLSTAEEIMQRDAVKARTRELIDSGKYKDSAEARRAANKEYPPVVNAVEGAQEAAYYHWKQQVKVQEKFAADLEKMKRKS